MSIIQLLQLDAQELPGELPGGTPYASYAYSYPHKTAYRALDPPRRLRDVWAGEDKRALYLYLHVPFCEMRCGFCNLFTAANPRDELPEQYLRALRREARRARDAIGPARYARMAVGGGTPTYLSAAQLDGLFQIAAELRGSDVNQIPTSVETSPRTVDAEKLRVLEAWGVDRISIGVQSFVEAEVAASGRAQKNTWVEQAIDRIRALDFPTLNIDLIYGLPGQTVTSWLASLTAALRWRPEELYLYPLYVRPLTGLDRRGRRAEDELRLACYRRGRDLLLGEGYEQVSMRMFRRKSAAGTARGGAGDRAGPVYCCQEDGMVGVGCGARSYTRGLHYSSDFAVGASSVRGIIDRYVTADERAFDFASYGCELDEEEQRRRWVIKSILRVDGLDVTAYRARFSSEPTDDVPELRRLLNAGLIVQSGELIKPTPAGLERSDAIGPALYSPRVVRGMREFALR